MCLLWWAKRSHCIRCRARAIPGRGSFPPAFGAERQPYRSTSLEVERIVSHFVIPATGKLPLLALIVCSARPLIAIATKGLKRHEPPDATGTRRLDRSSQEVLPVTNPVLVADIRA